MKRLALDSLWVPFDRTCRAKLVSGIAAVNPLQGGYLTTPSGFLGEVHVWRYMRGIRWHK